MLIRPNVVVFPESLSFFGPVPPLGLAYIAGVLRDAGHEVEVIDSVGEAIDDRDDFETPVGTMRRIGMPTDELIDRIPPDCAVLGITNMFLHEWPMVREIAGKAKDRFPGITVVLGGDNATAFWPWMFEQSDAVDHVVLGEGEATMVDLVNRLVAGSSLVGMQGLAVPRANGRSDPVTAVSPSG